MTAQFPLYSSITAEAPAKFLSLAGLRDSARSPKSGPKAGAPALTPYYAEAKTKEAAVNAEFHALVVDHDDDNLTVADIRSLYDAYGLAYLAYTTSSHQQDKGGVIANRWKVVIPLASPTSHERYAPLAVGLTLHHGADPAQARAQQVFYAPNKLTPSAPYEFIDATDRPLLDANDTGSTLVVAALSAYRQREAEREQKAAQAPAKPRSVSDSSAGIIGKVCQQFDIESELLRHGYRRVGKKYLSPQSSTGEPGVYIFTTDDGKERLYSHHGVTDPLSYLNHGGHSLDVFDVLVTLDYAGDVSRAVADLAPKVDPEGQKQRQREYMAEQDAGKPKEPHPPAQWPELADPFAEYVVPPFPLDVLPEAFQQFAREKSAQSGFDPGGYAICLLIASGNTVDHRAKLDLGPFSVPAYNWLGLVGDSGQGKSPVMKSSTHTVRKINDDIVAESNRQLGKWQDAYQRAKQDKADPPPKPPWKQRNALDTTTEALASLLVDNPEGVNLYHDEITELLGRMDAYSGKDGGKDRGVYLRAYDGGQVTINRATKLPLVVDNFSVGIIAGIQPEVLAAKFRKSGAGADGLYQRFAMYCLRPAGEVNYMARTHPFTEQNAAQVFTTIQRWNEDGTPLNASLSHGAQKAMQDYHNQVRKLATRTAAKRFAEHLDKFPGFLGRLAFALHVTHAAAAGEPPAATLEAETMHRAMKLMRVLYRHSEAVYSVLDMESGEVRALVKSAAEAILCKGWERFKRGDLTRNATYWQGADRHHAENAIDYLIELGWIADVTPPPVAGKRGRKSDGVFQVNPAAHRQFAQHAERITQARAERFQALQTVAGGN